MSWQAWDLFDRPYAYLSFTFFFSSSSNSNCGKDYKLKTHLVKHFAQAHGFGIRSNSPRPIMKTRSAFYLQTTLTTKLSRKLCRSVIKSKKAARQPSYAISLNSVKAECELALFAGSSNLWILIHSNFYCFHSQSQIKLLTLILLILRIYWSVKRRIAVVSHSSQIDLAILRQQVVNGSNWLHVTYCQNPRRFRSPNLRRRPMEVWYMIAFPTRSLSRKNLWFRIRLDVPLSLPQTWPVQQQRQHHHSPTCLHLSQPRRCNSRCLPQRIKENMIQQVQIVSYAQLDRRKYDLLIFNACNFFSTNFFAASSCGPPTKRPNKDPMPSYRPSPEQYAAMIEAAKEAGQPLPSTHVSHAHILKVFISHINPYQPTLTTDINSLSFLHILTDEWKTKNCSNHTNRLRT